MVYLKYKVINFINGCKSLLKWRKLIYNDRDYDWVYMLYMERRKLHNMYERINDESLLASDKVRYIDISIKLINIILDSDGMDDCSNYVNIKNCDVYKNMVKLGISSEIIEEHQTCYIRQAKALSLYNKIRTMYMFDWWV